MDHIVTEMDLDGAGRLTPQRCSDLALAALAAEAPARPVTFSLDLRGVKVGVGEVIRIAVSADKATRSLAFVSAEATTAGGEPVFLASAVCARETVGA